MGLSVIPTNIGGVNIPLAQLQGPLSSLFQNQSSQNLLYPADLASNPVMGHAVQFSIFDYTSGFATGVGEIGGNLANVGAGIVAGDASAITAGAKNLAAMVTLPSLAKVVQAKTYDRIKKGIPLANISLFMPETLAVEYTSSYDNVSLTDVLGLKGFIGNAIQDFGGNEKQLLDKIKASPKSAYAQDAIGRAAEALNTKVLGGKAGLGSLVQQGLGSFTNPQLQLLYKGVALRTFTLEFILTPKSASEAKTVKDICDSFAFYSLPGLSGAAEGNSGQYLTPPQIFQIKFKFLGGNGGLIDSVTNVFKSALSNIGLGFLTTQNPTDTITKGADAKIMTINDCVLENVMIDYAPNGWAAYNDGYPIQTRLTLSFKETKIVTKEDIKNSKVSTNAAEGPGVTFNKAVDYANSPGNSGWLDF
jgi:hypothetical protein